MSNCLCPLQYTQQVLKGKWAILIIYKIDSSNGIRFLELKKQLSSISSATLTKQLNYLIESEIIERIDNQAYPRVVTYKFTPKGLELKSVVEKFQKWGQKYM